ncbi:MAG: ArsR family transcriptional regulator [Methanoregula sp.]
MRQELVHYFTEKEKEFVNILVSIGVRDNIARVLVFISGTAQTTSHDIERGIDMRQPEVSLTLKYLLDKKWIRNHENIATRQGRPIKRYTLAKPISEIVDSIQEEKTAEMKHQMGLLVKLKKFV